MEVRTTVRKWGNSLGIIIPAETIQAKQLHEGEEISIIIGKQNQIKTLFGSLKHSKINAQKIKDRIRVEEA